MTAQEAEQTLQKGCRHNPWSEDVCANCAKDILGALKSIDTEPQYRCPGCGSPVAVERGLCAWCRADD